jgi:hypothetical protein
VTSRVGGGLRVGGWWCAALLLAVAACTPHPVGPARTEAAYEGKARTTAEGALSSVNTVDLLVQATLEDRTFAGYPAAVVSEQEDAITGLQGTFGSIQPPSAASDELRRTLDDLLSTAAEDITAVRLAVRRGEVDVLPDLQRALQADARDLQQFLEEHGG